MLQMCRAMKKVAATKKPRPNLERGCARLLRPSTCRCAGVTLPLVHSALAGCDAHHVPHASDLQQMVTAERDVRLDGDNGCRREGSLLTTKVQTRKTAKKAEEAAPSKSLIQSSCNEQLAGFRYVSQWHLAGLLCTPCLSGPLPWGRQLPSQTPAGLVWLLACSCAGLQPCTECLPPSRTSTALQRAQQRAR